MIGELLDFVDDVIDDLGSRHEIETIENILDKGTGADRQLEVYNKSNNLVDVVDYITSQTIEGI